MRLLLYFLLYTVFLAAVENVSALPPCTQDDYRFEYTECDGLGNRWRVSVPKKSPTTCSGGFAPPMPAKAVNCTFACDMGRFLDIETQQCERCKEGTYSTGGGVRHDDFAKLPDGFAIANEDSMQFFAESDEGGGEQQGANCSSGGWRTRDDGLLMYVPSPCISVLSYSVHLVRPGELKYVYLYPDSVDVMFMFQIQNEQCQASDDFYRRSTLFPPVTPEGKWRSQTVNLKSGQSVITWKAMVMHGAGQPIYIRQIDVSGLPFSGQCTNCPKGTYSGGASSTCTPCAPGTYAPRKGMSNCAPCDQDTYSGPRAAQCEKRPTCQPSDYYEIHEPCDASGKTRTYYKWVQPKICTERDGGATLPANKANEPCPPCNPGTTLINGSCAFCPDDHYSDGRGACAKCATNTAPNYGYYYSIWNRMPPRLKAECQSMDESDRNVCKDMDTWIPMGGRISTGKVRRQNLYLSLLLEVPKGFRDPFGTAGASTSGSSSNPDLDTDNPISHVTFVFETKCSGGCGFYFIEQTSGEQDAMIVASWNGTSKNLSFTYPIARSSAITYGWIFIPYDGVENEASIYSIRVENVVGGGASECRPCPLLAGGKAASSGCVSCPPGHYMTADTRQCLQCVNDTYLNVTRRVGVEACVPCGLNLRSTNGVECGVADCRMNISDRMYDLSGLKGFYQTRGVSIFGREGSRYVHTYNVSVCAQSGANEKATCASTLKDGGQMGTSTATGLICRTTAIPQDKDNVIYANPLVLADQLVGVTDDSSTIVEGINISAANIGEWKWRQLFFVYRLRSSEGAAGGETLAAKNCPRGRGALVVFRCDPAGGASSMASVGAGGERGVLSLPTACADGTCDGCLYALLITSPHACPRCSPADYKRIVGECRDGQQAIHYIPNTKDCVPMADDEHRHSLERVPCSLLTFQMRMLIVGSVVLCVFLVMLIVYVWKKNQRLEYKYMKLIESSSYGKEGELPAVESCGLQDDEDEEQGEDGSSPSERVVFAKGAWFSRKSPRVNAKIGGGGRRGRNGGDDSTALAADYDNDDA